ncbi:MAG: hypothetical protein ACYDHM_15460 [Acidiferrobacterales bacterium]
MVPAAHSLNTSPLLAAAGLGSGSTAGMLWSILFGLIGSVYFVYGKKQKRFATLFSGVALMAYTFMVSNTYAIFLVGIGLMAVPYFLDF